MGIEHAMFVQNALGNTSATSGKENRGFVLAMHFFDRKRSLKFNPQFVECRTTPSPALAYRHEFVYTTEGVPKDETGEMSAFNADQRFRLTFFNTNRQITFAHRRIDQNGNTPGLKESKGQ